MQPKNQMTVQPKAILLDMDGVLYHGDKTLQGAIAFIQSIKHIPHCFITNNPILLPTEIADKLERLGIGEIDANRIITSGEACALWLSQQKPSFRYFAVGAKGLHDALSQYGIEDETNADYVVVGEGEGLDYQSLTIGINLILKSNAQLISTNPDHTVDATINDEHIVLPGGGALVSPFISATAKQAITIGKPYPLLYEMALQRLNVTADECLMIGDRPDTDIKGAALLGIKTALVRTGRFLVGDDLPDDCPMPDFDVGSLFQLKKALSYLND